jgi:UDP-N-acetylglucosamine acyltransferase
MPPQIHPTAVVGPQVQLASDVQIGPYAILDGPIRLGAGCIVRPQAQLLGRITAGANNDFGSGAVIGDRPQHLAYRGEDTGVIIGDGNTFREHTTVHRAMPTATRVTTIGSRNLFMAGAHVGHDVTIGNDCVFVNAAVLGGHAIIADRVTMSAFSAVHQFARIGRLAFISGLSAASQDIPPFWMVREINRTVGVNLVGMRRAGVPSAEIHAVRAAFRFIYFEKLTIRLACQKMERQYAHMPAVMEVVEFIRTSKRGIPGPGAFRTDASTTATADADAA